MESWLKFAKDAVRDGIPIDTLASYRRTIKIQWNEEWKRTAEERGSEYFKVQPEIPKRGWYEDYKANRKAVVIISRMRFNHGRFKKHLHRINLVNTADCDVCGEEENISHLLFKCNKYQHYRPDFYKRILKISHTLPISIYELLTDARLIQELITFIATANISI